jgi:hypothetical protein
MKLTKNKKVIMGVVGVLTALGLYFILKPKKGSRTTPIEPPKPKYEKYKVITQTDPLNVRDTPDGTKIGSLPKGSIIFAKESDTASWHEYSADGENTSGYVSSQYLEKV